MLKGYRESERVPVQKRQFLEDVIFIRRMKIKAQQKRRKTGIFVSKGLFRPNVSLLKTQHHQRMKHNTIKQSLKYYYMVN